MLKPYRVLVLMLGGPMMVDLLLGLQMFYANLRTVELGVPPRYQCLLSVAWSTGYIVSAHVAGRWSTPKRAGAMMVGALLCTAAIVCTVFLVPPSYPVFLTACLILGLTVGFYFTPFQVKMGHIHPFRSMATVAAVYNISWSSGIAIGSLGCGYIMALPGTKWIGSGIAVMLTLVQLAMLTLAGINGANGERTSEDITREFASTPVQRWCGWMGVFIAFFLYAGMSGTLWPNLGNELGLSRFQIGAAAFAMVLPLPLLSLGWARLKRNMRRPFILSGTLVLMGLAYMLVPLTHSMFWRYVMLVLVGVGWSGATFHGVYYSNIDPVSRERSVGINECTVGMASIAGPSIMGFLAWNTGATLRPYAAGCLFALLTAGATLFLWSRRHALQPRLDNGSTTG